MNDHRAQKIFSRLVDVRAGETRPAVLFFLYFFLITFPAYIIKPVKVSLFLVNFSQNQLPFAYLTTALLIGFVATLNFRLLNRLPRRRYISSTIIFFVVCLILFWLLFRPEPGKPEPSSRILAIIYWFWSDVFIATSVTQFWISVNDILHPRQARRLVGFFVSGGLLGGIAGSLLARRLAEAVGTENLLILCPGLLVLTLVVVNLIYRASPVEGERSRSQESSRLSYLESFHVVRRNPYLLLLAGLLGASAIVSQIIDFQFTTVIKWTYVEKNERTAFLASFFAVLLIISYFIQVLGTSRILKKFGIRVGLMLTPFLLTIGSVSVFLVPVTPAAPLLIWAVAVRGTDKSLENTLSQSVRELLYIPVPAALKYKAKLFIDMFVNKFATAVGALLILLLYTLLRIKFEYLSLIVVVFSAAWILLIYRIYKEYIDIVGHDLSRMWEDGEKVVAEHVDVDATRLIFDTIQSRDRSSALYAMNLFDLVKKDKLTPELKEVLSFKEEEIRARSMGKMLDIGGESFFSGIEEVLAEKEFGIQVQEIMELDVYQKMMAGEIGKIAADRRPEAEVSRMEAAKLIGLMPPTQVAVENLIRLLQDESPEVLNYALESAGKIRRKESVPHIIRLLANPAVRQMAQSALETYGEKIFGDLKAGLEDKYLDIAARRAIPDVLAQVGTQKAADLLIEEIRKDLDEKTETDLIDALYKIRAKDPGVTFKVKKIVPAVLDQIRQGYEALLDISRAKEAGEFETSRARLEGRLSLEIKQIFDLLSLICPKEDTVKAYQNLCQGTRKSIDYSLELLDNIVPKELTAYLFPLIDDLPLEEKIRRAKKLFKNLAKETD